MTAFPPITRLAAPFPYRTPPVLPGEETMFRQAYSRIEEMIATLQLSPGQVVSENMLAEHLGLGRTPVREALQQLSREDLVLIMPRRGIVVAQIDVRKQLRLLEYRRYMEECLVAFATRRATESQRTALNELAARMEISQSSGIKFLSLDSELNHLLLDAARNEYVSSAMRMVQGASRRFWFANDKLSANLDRTVKLHAALARAVGNSDEPKAVQALTNLLDNVEAFTRATLDH